MNTCKKIIFALTVCFMLLPFMGKTVYASTGTISFSDPSVKVGESVSVTVKVATTDNSKLGGVDMTLSYDPALIEFESGSSASGDSGTVRIAGVVDSADSTTLSYSLKFKALKAGTAKITVSSYEIIDIDYAGVDISKVGSSAITIAGETEAKLSSDCTLSSLQISPGTLSPAFDKNTLNYTATVSNTTSKVAVSATPTHSGASVTGVTGTDLSVGKNTVRVIVTAESGADVAYNIEVTRQEEEKKEEVKKEEEKTEDTEKSENITTDKADAEVEVEIAGVTFYICEIPEEEIPEGFSVIGYNYEDKVVNALEKNNIILFYLRTDESPTPRLYYFNEETKGFALYLPLDAPLTYAVIEDNTDLEVPKGFTKTEVSIGGIAVDSWQSDANSEYFLLYLTSSEGREGFYMYDVIEKTVQRYYSEGHTDVAGTESEGSSDSDWKARYDELNGNYTKAIRQRMLFIYVLIVLAAVLAIAVINLALKLSDKRSGMYYDDDEDDFDDIDEEPEDDNEDIEFIDDYEAEEEKIEPVIKEKKKKEKKKLLKKKEKNSDDDIEIDEDDFDDSDDFELEIFDFDEEDKK